LYSSSIDRSWYHITILPSTSSILIHILLVVRWCRCINCLHYWFPLLKYNHVLFFVCWSIDLIVRLIVPCCLWLCCCCCCCPYSCCSCGQRRNRYNGIFVSYNETTTGYVHQRKNSNDNSSTIRLAAALVAEVPITIEEQWFKDPDDISIGVGNFISMVHTTVVAVDDRRFFLLHHPRPTTATNPLSRRTKIISCSFFLLMFSLPTAWLNATTPSSLLY